MHSAVPTAHSSNSTSVTSPSSNDQVQEFAGGQQCYCGNAKESFGVPPVVYTGCDDPMRTAKHGGENLCNELPVAIRGTSIQTWYEGKSAGHPRKKGQQGPSHDSVHHGAKCGRRASWSEMRRNCAVPERILPASFSCSQAPGAAVGVVGMRLTRQRLAGKRLVS